jgi:hypothetical protein
MTLACGSVNQKMHNVHKTERSLHDMAIYAHDAANDSGNRTIIAVTNGIARPIVIPHHGILY